MAWNTRQVGPDAYLIEDNASAIIGAIALKDEVWGVSISGVHGEFNDYVKALAFVEGVEKEAAMSAHLERLVCEWRDAIQAVDRMTVEERRKDSKPLERIIAAHNALLKYAIEEMGG